MTSKHSLWSLIGALAAAGTSVGSCTVDVRLGPGNEPDGTGGGGSAGEAGNAGTSGAAGGGGLGGSGGTGNNGGDGGRDDAGRGGSDGGDGNGGNGNGGSDNGGSGNGGEGGKGGCGHVSGLRFWTVAIGTVDYVILKNPSDCAIDLEGVEIELDDHDELFSNQEIDCTLRLPARELPAGASVHVRENARPGDIDVAASTVTACDGLISFNPGRGGAAYLCAGECSSNTLIDAVAFVAYGSGQSAAPPAPRYDVIFDRPLRGVTLFNDEHVRYQRVATESAFPNYLAMDWENQARTVFSDFENYFEEGFRFVAQDAGELFVDFNYVTAEPADIGPSTDTPLFGAQSVVIRHLGSDGTSDSLGLPLDAYSMPRDLTYFARVTEPGAGFLELRSASGTALKLGFEETGVGVSFGSGERSEVPFDLDTWYRIELRDVDWARSEFDLYVEGALVGRRLAFGQGASSVNELRLNSSSAGSTAYFDAIEFWSRTYPIEGGTGGQCDGPISTGGTGGKGAELPDCTVYGMSRSSNCQHYCFEWQTYCCGAPVAENYATSDECMGACASFTDAQLCCRLHYLPMGIPDSCGFAVGADTGRTPAICLD